jgi:taurine dioxygenase
MTRISVRPEANGFAAHIEGVDLSAPLTLQVVHELRETWLAHQVVSFAQQPLDHEALERFTRYFGDFGNDPYVKPIAGHDHILEVRREPDEEVAPFGGAWHSDWSFQQTPPSATILHAKIVPPIGGDTWYADGQRAYESLDPSLRDTADSLTAIHSARKPYSHEGYEKSGGEDRSMTILPSDNAWKTQEHPIVRTHPESGRKALWVNPVYTIGIKGLSEKDSNTLLQTLFAHALQEEFVYAHHWSKNMLTMWDNRSVQHCAQGGYNGHRRVLHRTTVAGDQPH